MAANPHTRSQEREFILWGMADDPTWPALNPSVTSSWPAMSRMVVARLAGPGGGLHQRRDHVEVERARVHLADVGERRPRSRGGRPRPRSMRSTASADPRRSSMSCWVPTGPLMPRSG